MKGTKTIGIILFFIIGFCLSFGRQLNAQPSAALQFQISFDQEEYKVKDPIYIHLELTNKGSEPVYINKRFYISSEDIDPKDKEVFFRVKGPSGEEVPYKAKHYDTGLPKTEYFVLLDPKESITSERKKNLKAYFDFKTPGKYKVTAVYQNTYGAEIGIDAFTDQVTSKTVTIKVVENE